MSGKGMVGPVSPEVSRKLANLGLLCAWLVVAWHCAVDGHGAAEGGPAWWASRFFSGCWVRFSVPFFFVASGYFLCGHCDERGWWPRELRKRVWSLVVPYAAWSLIYRLYACVLSVLANLRGGAPLTRNLPLGWGDWVAVFGLDLTENAYLYTLWFVRCLFLLVVVSPLLVAPMRGARGRFAGGALVAALFVLTGVHRWLGETVGWGAWGEFFNVGLAVRGMCWFAVGLWLRRFPLRAWGAPAMGWGRSPSGRRARRCRRWRRRVAPCGRSSRNGWGCPLRSMVFGV